MTCMLNHQRMLDGARRHCLAAALVGVLVTACTNTVAHPRRDLARPQASGVAIPGTNVHTLHSSRVDREFQIWVAPPRDGLRPPPPGPAHVLYVLAANLFFGTAVEMSRLMHQLFGEIAPVWVVGVAYPNDDFRLQGQLRTQDFTPVQDSGHGGGADRFLGFLREELHPFIAEQYQLTGPSTLFGASLGGLFTVYTALTAPDAFDHYIAASPSIWWGRESLFELEAQWATERDDMPAELFLGVGGLEESADIPFLAHFRMVTNVHKMADRLMARGYPSLVLTKHVFPAESHTSVVPAILTRGLRKIAGVALEPGTRAAPVPR